MDSNEFMDRWSNRPNIESDSVISLAKFMAELDNKTGEIVTAIDPKVTTLQSSKAVADFVLDIKASDSWMEPIRDSLSKGRDKFIETWRAYVSACSDITEEISDILPDSAADNLNATIAALMEKHGQAKKDTPVTDNLCTLFIKKCWAGNSPEICKAVDKIYLGTGNMTKTSFKVLNRAVYDAFLAASNMPSTSIVKRIDFGNANCRRGIINQTPVDIPGVGTVKTVAAYRHTISNLGMDEVQKNIHNATLHDGYLVWLEDSRCKAHTLLHLGKAPDGGIVVHTTSDYYHASAASSSITKPQKSKKELEERMKEVRAEITGQVAGVNWDKMSTILNVLEEMVDDTLTGIIREVIRPDHAIEDLVSIFFHLYADGTILRAGYMPTTKREIPNLEKDPFCELFQRGLCIPINSNGQQIDRNSIVKSIIGLLITPVDKLRVGAGDVIGLKHIEDVAELVKVPVNTVRAAAFLFGVTYYDSLVCARDTDTEGGSWGADSKYKYSQAVKFNVGLTNVIKSSGFMDLIAEGIEKSFNLLIAALNQVIFLPEKLPRSHGIALRRTLMSFPELLMFNVPELLKTTLHSVISPAMGILKDIGLKAAAEIAASDMAATSRKYRILFGLSNELVHLVIRQNRRDAGWEEPMNAAIPYASMAAQFKHGTSFPINFKIYDDEPNKNLSLLRGTRYPDQEQGTTDSVIDQMARHDTPPKLEFTNASNTALNMFGMVSKIASNLKGFYTKVESEIIKNVEDEQQKKAFHERIWSMYPGMEAKPVLIINDTVGNLMFSTHYGGIIQKADRLVLEKEYCRARAALESAYYIVANSRPLVPAELPDKDKLWEDFVDDRCVVTDAMRNAINSNKKMVKPSLESGFGCRTFIARRRNHQTFNQAANRFCTELARAYGHLPRLGFPFQVVNDPIVELDKIYSRMTDSYSAVMTIAGPDATGISRLPEIWVQEEGGLRVAMIPDLEIVDMTYSNEILEGRINAESHIESPRTQNRETILVGLSQTEIVEDTTLLWKICAAGNSAAHGYPARSFWSMEKIARTPDAYDGYAVSGYVASQAENTYLNGNCETAIEEANNAVSITYAAIEPCLDLPKVYDKYCGLLKDEEEKKAETISTINMASWPEWKDIADSRYARREYDEQVMRNVMDPKTRLLKRPCLLPYAETFDIHSHVYLYVDMGRSGRNERAAFYTMAILGLSNVKEMFRKAEEHAKETEERMKQSKSAAPAVKTDPESYIEGEVTRRINDVKLSAAKRQIEEKMEQLRRMKDDYIKYYNKYRPEIQKYRHTMAEGRELKASGSIMGADEEKLKAMIAKGTLRGVRIYGTYPKLKAIAYLPSTYIWVGPFIYNIGEIAVKIDNWGTPNAQVRFYGKFSPKGMLLTALEGCSTLQEGAMQWIQDDIGDYIDAPHVRNNTACLGNIDTALRQASNDLSLSQYIQYCSRYLHTVNLGDHYGKSIVKWPAVPATFHNLVKYGALCSGRITDRIAVMTGAPYKNDNTGWAMFLRPMNWDKEFGGNDAVVKALWAHAKKDLDEERYVTSDLSAAQLYEMYPKLRDASNQWVYGTAVRPAVDSHGFDITCCQAGERIIPDVRPGVPQYCYAEMERICASEHPGYEFSRMFAPDVRVAQNQLAWQDRGYTDTASIKLGMLKGSPLIDYPKEVDDVDPANPPLPASAASSPESELSELEDDDELLF